MKREVIWILALKFAALSLLWLLFFSGPHRPRVDAHRAASHLRLVPSPAEPASGSGRSLERSRDPGAQP